MKYANLMSFLNITVSFDTYMYIEINTRPTVDLLMSCKISLQKELLIGSESSLAAGDFQPN